MNRIEVHCEEVDPPSWISAAIAYVEGVLSKLELDQWEVSIILCTNKYMKDINNAYRGKNEPTDVLSFPQVASPDELPDIAQLKKENNFFLAGDILISLDGVQENASFFKVSPEEELRRLLIHGILHLSGMDHESNDLTEPMLAKQESLLQAIKERIYTI
ncbi:rRNA maturation RNase YbeY [Spirochaeta lutea]|uniref:Endoribonuclease YbeY n=1 Tax=Spirochaeta lutea TaxID=1480694 RepID=A0A098R236_9SPIO|nr:rRNA maturation RNase YbeY [Spirochaeta lutea]KGE73728.1 hypothetical protein DC28_00385 [Spirochaeta lutea]